MLPMMASTLWKYIILLYYDKQLYRTDFGATSITFLGIQSANLDFYLYSIYLLLREHHELCDFFTAAGETLLLAIRPEHIRRVVGTAL